MRLNVNEWQLRLIDRVGAAGSHGATRAEVLNRAVAAHARYIAAGGTMYDQGGPAEIEIAAPVCGPVREEFAIQPVTGKAIPVYAGEVLRLCQTVGNTCIDFNAYNLHDYKEYLDCGFNRHRGVNLGRGALVWSGSPRGRPLYAILDHSDRFEQYYQGHRCNAIMNEVEYGFLGHPNCQDTFAEAIREYGLTPDDVHDSYNLWMSTTVTADGKRQFHWNRAEKDDFVALLAIVDTLAVPVICGGDISAVNSFEPHPIRVQIHAASPSTRAAAALVTGRMGSFRSQLSPRDFANGEILPRRELVKDPAYAPNFLPAPARTTLELTLAPETERQLERFLATGNYLATKEQALLQCFLRWYEACWDRDRLNTRLAFRTR